jgi:hypothetical protein
MIVYFKRCGEAQIWNNLDKAVRNTLQKSFLNMSVLILTPTASQNANSLDNVLCPKLLEVHFSVHFLCCFAFLLILLLNYILPSISCLDYLPSVDLHPGDRVRPVVLSARSIVSLCLAIPSHPLDRLRTMFHRPKAVEIIQTKILQVSYHYIHEFLYDFKAFDLRYERILKYAEQCLAVIPKIVF